MPTKTRIDALETALLEYIQRYGLTDAARAAMLPRPPESCMSSLVKHVDPPT